MKFEQLYSSSSGNLYIVTAANGKRLMIECGVVWSKLQKALNYDLSGIVGCLVSHEHKDHSKAVDDVLNAGIDVYSRFGTLRAMDVWGKRKSHVLDTEEEEIDCFEVLNWSSIHDAEEPVIFVIKCDGESLLFATDTTYIVQRFWYSFSIIAIECSYDKDILRHRVDTKDINEELAKRLLTSHMSKQEAKRHLREFCDLSRCQSIHLLHLSRDNLDAEKTRLEIERDFFIETIICS